MMPETELLQYIHKTAEMGCEGILDVMDYTEGSELKNVLTRQLDEYRAFEQDAEKLLKERGERANDVGAMAKTIGARDVGRKLMADRSISKLQR